MLNESLAGFQHSGQRLLAGDLYTGACFDDGLAFGHTFCYRPTPSIEIERTYKHVKFSDHVSLT